MKAEEIIAEAKKHAEQHKLRKVLVKRETKDTPAEHEMQPVSKVHVTTPGYACYPDLDKQGIINLNKHAMEKRLSVHEFVFEVPDAKKSDEVATEEKVSKKKKSDEVA
jgi:hypothetical protein